jgi:hypothetical protein
LNELGNEWTILGKTSMLSSNLPWYNYFAISISLINIQNFR